MADHPEIAPLYSGEIFSIENLEEAAIIVATWERNLYLPDQRLLAAVKILREAAIDTCRHDYGPVEGTGYADEYKETCKKCGHVNVFEKDYT